ncbi:MAG: bifunctional 5,10-methylenetetrahydrofolate dehydrogenase/5,10-methenyltetrahydrofolate cyclohydrolase [Candidatus Woesearchaeota archaeon]
MTAKILDGRKLSEQIIKEVKAKVKKLKLKPGLAAILVGNNPASELYVNMKKKSCNDCGFHFELYKFKENSLDTEVIDAIISLNKNENIHGIMVQLPLPKHMDKTLVLQAIDPLKDVDGCNSVNLGDIMIKDEKLLPATPKGVITLLDYYKIPVKGKEVVIVGHSAVVGKPLAMMFLNRDATVTVCHEFTKDLKSHTSKADILISATGVPNLIKKNMVKKNAVVIDVGISKVKDKIAGDVDFNEVKKIASYITPVPGGVGPMTIASLLENVLIAMQEQVLKP